MQKAYHHTKLTCKKTKKTVTIYGQNWIVTVCELVSGKVYLESDYFPNAYKQVYDNEATAIAAFENLVENSFHVTDY